MVLDSQDNAVTFVSHTNLELQRYQKGFRQVFGCIPYICNMEEQGSMGEVREEGGCLGGGGLEDSERKEKRRVEMSREAASVVCLCEGPTRIKAK